MTDWLLVRPYRRWIVRSGRTEGKQAKRIARHDLRKDNSVLVVMIEIAMMGLSLAMIELVNMLWAVL